jgi:hypothetical protein
MFKNLIPALITFPHYVLYELSDMTVLSCQFISDDFNYGIEHSIKSSTGLYRTGPQWLFFIF